MSRVLVTGGAGFIGSNLVETLLGMSQVEHVRVIDNLSTGSYDNLTEFESNTKFEFINGDIRDYDFCLKAVEGMDLISHQAALGSVPRSIKDPITSNDVNITGTLHVLQAAKESKVKRVVFAASSSTYGDSIELPKVEDKIGKPLSPYAITKYVNELYADIYKSTYDLDYIGLRYFNVFGPKQSPKGAYAAVIPIFITAALADKSARINGDGSFSRDFTYVQNAVQANCKALFTDNQDALNRVYNVACGERTTLNELWKGITEVLGKDIEAEHGPQRQGDIPHSLANIELAQKHLGYNPSHKLKEGLRETIQWYKNQ